MARANTQRLGIDNIEFRRGEWFALLAGMTFDLIASNPPYVAEGDPHLSQGDVRFEPQTALIAGADGLAAIRVIAHDARRQLRRGGVLLIEHGFDQAVAVQTLLTGIGYREVATVTDIQGHSRVSAGQL